MVFLPKSIAKEIFREFLETDDLDLLPIHMINYLHDVI